MSIDFRSAFRSYWSATLLTGAAVVFLLVGSPTKDAIAGAGFAFAGAAVTRMIDIAKERREEAAQEDVGRRRDLDETRRLAYMALVARTSAGRVDHRRTRRTTAGAEVWMGPASQQNPAGS